MANTPSLDDSAPWIVIAWQSIVRTIDGGDRFYQSGGYPLADRPFGAAQLADGTSVLLSNDRVWWTLDGDTWDFQELPATGQSVAAIDDVLYVGTTAGTLTGHPTSPLTNDGPPGFVELTRSDRGLTGIASDNRIYVLETAGGAWSQLPTIAGNPKSAIMADDGAVYVGMVDGRIERFAGRSRWTARGCSPRRPRSGRMCPKTSAVPGCRARSPWRRSSAAAVAPRTTTRASP
jgi:hypothetical protein